MFIKWTLSFLFIFLSGLLLNLGTAYAQLEIQSYVVSTSDFERSDISTKFYLNTPLLSPDYEKSFEEQKLQVERLASFLCHLNLVPADDCQISRWVGPNYNTSDDDMEKSSSLASYSLIVKNQYYYNLQIAAKATQAKEGRIHLIKAKGDKYLGQYCEAFSPVETENLCKELCKSECEVKYNESLSLDKLNHIKYDIPIQWQENFDIANTSECLRLTKLYCAGI